MAFAAMILLVIPAQLIGVFTKILKCLKSRFRCCSSQPYSSCSTAFRWWRPECYAALAIRVRQ